VALATLATPGYALARAKQSNACHLFA